VEASATVRFLRVSPRKARLVADEIRGKMVGDALAVLEYGIRKGVSKDMTKLVKSAVANMQSKRSDAAVDPEELRVSDVLVKDGPRLGRHRARAQGRVGRIIKRMCHITLTVSN
jgi:large subunit ribosomal protein L22